MFRMWWKNDITVLQNKMAEIHFGYLQEDLSHLRVCMKVKHIQRRGWRIDTCQHSLPNYCTTFLYIGKPWSVDWDLKTTHAKRNSLNSLNSTKTPAFLCKWSRETWCKQTEFPKFVSTPHQCFCDKLPVSLSRHPLYCMQQLQYGNGEQLPVHRLDHSHQNISSDNPQCHCKCKKTVKLYKCT